MPFYAGLQGRRAEPARDRRGARRRPLRRRPPLLAGARRASPPRSSRRVIELPVVGSYHTELAAYAGLRSGDAAARGRRCELGRRRLLRRVPARAVAERRRRRGRSPASGIDAGADRALGPRRRHRSASTRRCATPGCCPASINVLYAGRLTQGEGRRPARRRVPRGARSATRACTSCWPAAARRRARCASASASTRRFLGWLEGDALAAPTPSADVFLFASRTDTFGQVVLEAQASGLPVVAVAEGGPLDADRGRRDAGCCARPTPRALADARARAGRRRGRARRLARGGARGGARAHLGAARSSGSPTATGARSAAGARGARRAVSPGSDRSPASAGELRADRALRAAVPRTP